VQRIVKTSHLYSEEVAAASVTAVKQLVQFSSLSLW